MKSSKVSNFENIVQLGFLGVLFPFVIGIVYTASKTENFDLKILEVYWVLAFCGFATVFILTELKIKIHMFILQLVLFAMLAGCSVELKLMGMTWLLALAISSLSIAIMHLHNINRSS